MFELFLIAALSAAFASVLVLLVSLHRRRQLEEALAVARQECEGGRRERESLQQRLNEVIQAQQVLEKSLAVESEKQTHLQQQLQQARSELREVRAQLEEKQQACADLQSHNTELRTREKEREAHFASQLQQLDEQKGVLKREFENLANRIFEDKGKSFSQLSRQSLDSLLNPFKQQIVEFRTKVEDIHHKETQQQAQLQSELKQLQALNQQITAEAHELATALRGQKKMQGNWGEMILENVLDRSGLRKEKDYRREVSFTTEEGRSRPDVIIYLPDEKHLVIDAKVSLSAYTRYVNATSEAESELALAEHVSAISARIKELADKNYYELPGLNSPEMVFMFIPIESAFVEALKADETLFQKALKRNVLVATPTTLLTSLNIVRQLWRFEDQNRHTAELAEKATKVYDKLNGFLGSMEGVGRALDRARDSYDKAYAQLYTGRGNLIKQANEFRKLGVSVKAELPHYIAEKAELELMPASGDESEMLKSDEATESNGSSNA